MAIWLVISVLLSISRAGDSFLMSSEKKLSMDLAENYGSTNIRPVRNSSDGMVVTMRLLIAQLINFDEPNQQLILNFWQRMSWRDEFMVWNPEDYNGQDTVIVLPNDIWNPRIVLVENVNYDFESMREVEVIVSSDGTVNAYTPVIYQVSCQINVRKFPFDVQFCNLTFLSWIYDSSKLEMEFSTDKDAMQNVFANNGVWNLVSLVVHRYDAIYACCRYPFHHIVYTVTLERASMFYVMSVLVPSVLLTSITLSVFCMPPESGEKISLGMTNLLAFVLFQQLIAGYMPPLGNEAPLVAIYIFCMVVMGCASIFVSVYVLHLFHTDKNKRLPKGAAAFVKLMRHVDCEVTWQTFAVAVDKCMFSLFLSFTILIIVSCIIAFLC